MTSPRHLSLFLRLGLFWGISPSLYRYWGVLGMPVSHVIVLTGIGVAAAFPDQYDANAQHHPVCQIAAHGLHVGRQRDPDGRAGDS